MPPLTRRFATPMVAHKAGCSMEKRKANDHFDSAQRRLLPLNQADNKLQKDRTSQIKTDDLHLRQNGIIDTFSPLLFEEPKRCSRLLKETCPNSFDAECTPKKSVSPATLVGAHCYFFNVPGAPVHKEIVLDTIEQWRKSKAWPGFERICHMLYQRHDLSKAVVQEELNLLVDYEAVIKVDYKDNTSYRNAAKWVTTPLLDIMGNIKPCGTSHVRVDGVHECQLRTADIVIFLALLLLLHLISGVGGSLLGEATGKKPLSGEGEVSSEAISNVGDGYHTSSSEAHSEERRSREFYVPISLDITDCPRRI
ncbi:uncharacterized protein LOC142775069 [Rhipicephalus microplus]|uniref:uncharacterized protein LOC142775069 n=1 Tax=Rhipicephalus microplus TaxID=6941 RepID=UPI003F6CC668